jgi:hypothetical protein
MLKSPPPQTSKIPNKARSGLLAMWALRKPQKKKETSNIVLETVSTTL